MDKPMIDALAERVARLERENRRLRWGGLVAFGCLTLVVIFAGADAGKVIEAEKVILRDGKGQMRALFEVKPSGEPGLSLFDDKGKTGIDMGIDPQIGPRLSLDDAVGKTTLHLSVNKFGASHIWMEVEDGPLVTLLASADKVAELTLGTRADGERLAARVADHDGGISIMAGDKDLERSLSMGGNPDGTVDLNLSDKNQKNRFILGGKADGSTYLELRDKDGKLVPQIQRP